MSIAKTFLKSIPDFLDAMRDSCDNETADSNETNMLEGIREILVEHIGDLP